jgi:hypothetical protein
LITRMDKASAQWANPSLNHPASVPSPGKKANADAEGASQVDAKGDDAVTEPKSLVELKFLADEQRSGYEPATAEPSAVENAGVVSGGHRWW